MKKIYIIIFGLVILIIFGLTAVVINRNQQIISAYRVDNQSFVRKFTWKQYQNKINGYAFLYPDDLILQNTNPDQVGFVNSNQMWEIGIGAVPTEYRTIEESISNHDKLENQKPLKALKTYFEIDSKKIVDDVEVYRYHLRSVNLQEPITEKMGQSLMFIKDKKIFYLTSRTGGTQTGEDEKVLNSLRFLK